MTTKRGAGLEVRKDAILQALVVSRSISEAAERVGCSRKAIYRWLNHDRDLLTELRDIRRGQIRDAADALAGAAEKAAEALVKILEDETVNPAVRVQAAGKVLEMAGTYRRLELETTKAAFCEAEGPVNIESLTSLNLNGTFAA